MRLHTIEAMRSPPRTACFGLDRHLLRSGGLVARVGGATRFNKQQVDLAVGYWSMFHALRNDVEIAGTQLDV
jgi:hypothetical protein